MTKQEVLQAVMAKTAQWHYAIRYALRCKQAADGNAYGPAPAPNQPQRYSPPDTPSGITLQDRFDAMNYGDAYADMYNDGRLTDSQLSSICDATKDAFLDTRKNTVNKEFMERVIRNPDSLIPGAQPNRMTSVFPYKQYRSEYFYRPDMTGWCFANQLGPEERDYFAKRLKANYSAAFNRGR